jgi:hypothetical protein
LADGSFHRIKAIPKEKAMTSFAFAPLPPTSPMSGSLALDFGPAALLVGAALLLIGVFLAFSAEPGRSTTPPRPRSRTAMRLRRLARDLHRRVERHPQPIALRHAGLA